MAFERAAINGELVAALSPAHPIVEHIPFIIQLFEAGSEDESTYLDIKVCSSHFSFVFVLFVFAYPCTGWFCSVL